jgi:uncharacterized protein involved in outer membrane biogenesis
MIILSAPSFINWQNNKGFIENIASDFIGYRVKINGDLQVQILPNPKIYADDISIESASGLNEIATIEHVILTKKLSDLLSLDWSVDQFIINRPKISLITDESGVNNWEPLKIKSSNYYSKKLNTALKNIYLFKDVVVENANLNYNDVLNNDQKEISRTYLSLKNNKGIINITGNSFVNEVDQKINVSLNLENINAVKVDTLISNDKYMVSLKGVISNLNNFNNTQFVGKIVSEFEDANNLKINKSIDYIKKKYFDLKEFKFSSDITASKNEFNISKIELKSKYNSLQGNVSYKASSEITDISLKLDIDKIYIKKTNDIISNKDVKEIKWADDSLDFSYMSNYIVNAYINCIECTYGNKTFYQVNLKSTLENSNLVINQFNLKSSDKGYLKLSATVGLNSPLSFEASLEANEFPIDTIISDSLANKFNFEFNGNAGISSSGVSEKAIFSNMAGSFDFNLANVELNKIDDSDVKGALDGLLFNKNRVSFKSKVGDVKIVGAIRDGVLRNTDTTFNLAGEEIVARGKFDLANLTANYRIEPINLRRNNLGVVLSGNINDLEVISDKITPKGVLDGFNRIVTTNIVKKTERKKLNTPFDFEDSDNLEKNINNYLFEK